jgi:hypothetical protein
MFFRKNLPPFCFDSVKLEELALDEHDHYSVAKPFRHMVFDDFLSEQYAELLLDLFPNRDSVVWKAWGDPDKVNHPNKQAIWNAAGLNSLAPEFQNIVTAFNTYPFLNFLSKLTGIEKLLPDPYLYGGGLHQILNGGKLAVHTDFNDHKALNIYRRINVLLYLNKDWSEEYNGQLELWDENLDACVKSISPVFNRLVVFNTDKRSFHGHPKPLNVPEDTTRKSLAFYYYTAQPDPDESYSGETDWQQIETD